MHSISNGCVPLVAPAIFVPISERAAVAIDLGRNGYIDVISLAIHANFMGLISNAADVWCDSGVLTRRDTFSDY